MEARIYNYATWVQPGAPEVLDAKYTQALQQAGFNILQKVEHHFKPQGYTALYLLAESHFAIHTFPEHNAVYIELSSCVKSYFDAFVREVSK